MAVTKFFSEVTIGGSAANNPTNYSWTTYDNYPNLDLGRTYQRINVIYVHSGLKVTIEVTGLAEVENGHAKMGPGDLCYVPCPPDC